MVTDLLEDGMIKMRKQVKSVQFGTQIGDWLKDMRASKRSAEKSSSFDAARSVDYVGMHIGEKQCR